jgi:hypothetical protein
LFIKTDKNPAEAQRMSASSLTHEKANCDSRYFFFSLLMNKFSKQVRNMSFDYGSGTMFGGANPRPGYLGQCIVGESGNLLIATRVHSKKGVHTQWRNAPVQCGMALDGGLQSNIVKALQATRQNTFYIDSAILNQKDHKGAIEAVLKNVFPGRDIKVEAADGKELPEGAAVTHLATAVDRKYAITVPAAATITNLGFQAGVTFDSIHKKLTGRHYAQ